MVVTQHSPVPGPHKRGGALRSAGRLSSLHSRILHVATQPCDSRWICAKSVFENAECQKRKSRGRQHDRNRPVETETSKSSFCTKLSAKDPKTWVGGRGGRGLHAMPCIHPAEPLQLLLDPEPGKNPEPRRWAPEPRLPRVTLGIGLPDVM